MAGYDYVIIGGGSAGCTLAARLSEDPACRVCLLEAGGANTEMLVRMPAGVGSLIKKKSKHNWGFWTQPEPHLDNRELWWPRGRGLGGSSAINGMVYTRGHPQDYDEWRQMGLAGWAWDDVLPYFRRLEGHHRGGDLHGADGPLHISGGESDSPFHDALIAAGQQAGYPVTPDFNGAEQEGFGRYDLTIDGGKRWSTAAAYLRPAAERANLTVVTDARTTRIVIERGRAIAVDYAVGRQHARVEVLGEAILCAGAVQSPHILQLSGVGDPARLKDAGVAAVHDLPGVGENLQDHLEFYFQLESKRPVSLYPAMNPIAKALIGARWLLRKDGLGATNHFETCGFIRSRAGIEYPDIQYHFFPLAVSYDGSSMAKGHGFQAHVGPMRSKSRGFVRLRSADAADKPVIRFNYMSHPDDWTEMRACVRLTREIFAQPAMAPFAGRELRPGADVTSDDAIDAFVREHVESAYHPSCTCRIGAANDPMAVVGADLRVHGLEALRVVDSSVMPSVTTGNLNAPTIMIGEKGADHILGRALASASNADFARADRWRTAQR